MKPLDTKDLQFNTTLLVAEMEKRGIALDFWDRLRSW